MDGGDTSEIWRYPPTHSLRKARHENCLIGKCDLDGFTGSACIANAAAVQCPHVAIEGARRWKSILTALTRCSARHQWPYDTVARNRAGT